TDASRLSRPPIQALYLVRAHHALHRQTSRDEHLKWVAFHLTRDRAKKRQADSTVICRRRQNQCRSASCLLMSCLRIKRDPDGISSFRNVRAFPAHHISFPTAFPVCHSPGRLSSVMPRSNSARVSGCGKTDRTTKVLSTRDNSTAALGRRPAWIAKDLGMRRARLLPHFCTRVFMIVSCIY